MTSTANTKPSTSTTREQFEIKTIIHDAVSDGVKDLVAIVKEMERSGKYNSQELKESEEFVALGEERERLAVLIEEISELMEKLKEESRASERAEIEFADRVRERRGRRNYVAFRG